MKARARIGLAAVLVLLAVAAGWMWRNSRSSDVLELYGNVDIRVVELGFRQPGRILSMAVEEGDAVKEGQMLAQLDYQPYEDALAVVEAQQMAAGAELEKSQAGNRPQEIAQSESNVRHAEAALRNAERDLARQTALLPSGASSQRIVDAARAARDQAAAALSAAQQAFSLQRSGARSEDVRAAQARHRAAVAISDQAQTALRDTRLVAPADAVVMTRVHEPGAIVPVGAPVYLLSIQKPVYVRAYVNETELGRVVPGGTVRIRTDSSTKVYTGQIGFISPTAEFTPKSVETADLRTDLVYRLRIVVRDADNALRQGMPVTITVLDPARKKT